MSCRNYVGQKLQLPVARSASERIFPGCFFHPEMKNDYTGQSTVQFHEFSFLPNPFLFFILGYFFFPPYCRSSTAPTICFF